MTTPHVATAISDSMSIVDFVLKDVKAIFRQRMKKRAARFVAPLANVNKGDFMSVKSKNVKRSELKRGDIFSFAINPGLYGYGVIVSKINEGHVAEIFDYLSNTPKPSLNLLSQTLYPPLILDTLSLLERRTEGEWHLIGHSEEYSPGENVKNVKFVWGILGKRSTTDIFNNHEKISDEEAAKWPIASPWGDWDVKEYLKRQGLLKDG